MKEKTRIVAESDYEREIEELGRKKIRKSRKKTLIWLFVFLAIGGFGVLTVQIIFMAIGFILTLVMFVIFCKKSGKLKDTISVRKVGLQEYKRLHGGASAPVSSPVTTNPNVNPNRNNQNMVNYSNASSNVNTSYRRPEEENVDPEVYGPIKGF